MSSPVDLSPILDRLDAHDRRVEELLELNRQVMTELLRLSENGIGSNKVLQDLRGVCEELTGNRPTTSGPGRQTTTTTEEPTTPSSLSKCPKRPAASRLQITAVFKEETDSLYRVTVCYVSPEKPQISYRVSWYDSFQKVENHDFGVVVLERNKPENNESAYLDIEFSLFQSEYHVYTNLKISKDSPEEVYLDNLQVTVEPGHKIIYNPRSDVDIQLDIINEGGSSGYNLTQLLVKSSTESNTVDSFYFIPGIEFPPEFHIPDYVENIDFTQTIHSKENTTLHIHMPFSSRRAAGIVIFQMSKHIHCSQSCLVDTLVVSQRIVFYPQGESGPLPTGFLGFIKAAHSDEQHWNVQECSEDNRRSECILYCSVIGDNPRVHLSRADNGPVSPHYEINHNQFNYSASSFWEFENPRLEDAGDYLCEAMSRDGGHVISETLTITVGKVAQFVPELTRARAFPNGTLIAQCTATGRPAPTVRLGPYYGREPGPFWDEADISPNITLDSSTVQVTLVSSNWKKYDRYDVFDNIYCYTSNAEHSEYMHPMEVEEVE